MTQDDDRAVQRDERERQTIIAMAMIAPTPELIRQVMSLHADSDHKPHSSARPATRAEADQLLPKAD